MDDRDWDQAVDRLAGAAQADGEPTRWYEELWSAGARDEIDVPWDRADAYPPLVDYLGGRRPAPGARAVVVGAGLGADAELLARSGFATVAFDIAPSAVDLARRRHPDSPVDYRQADLLDLPEELRGAFDLVVEVFTLQALARPLQDRAAAGLRSLLAPGGEALVVQFVPPPERDPDTGPPWLLDRGRVEAIATAGYPWVELATRPHPRRPDGLRLWVGRLGRTG